MPEDVSQTQRFLDALKGRGLRVCIVEGESEYSYSDLVSEIALLRDQCRGAGIRSGDVVGISGDFTFDSVALFFALTLESAIVAPLGAVSEREEKKRIERASVSYSASSLGGILSVDKVVPSPSGSPLFEKLKGAPGLILFSSGTTGLPKVMLHDLDKMLGCYSLRPQRNYSVLLFLFFDHIGGLDTLFRSLMNGSRLVIAEHRKPEMVAQLIERFKIDVLPMTPTALNLLILSGAHERYDLSSLKIISYGAEPMPKWLLKRLHELFPSVQLQQKFGVSEMHVLRVKSRASNSLAMKIEDEHSSYKIVNGELLLKTQCPIVGYLNVEQSPFDDEGWFHTGDIVESFDDGFLRVKGRASEVINVGGEKVLPVDVESVLLEMPEVEDCYVCAAPSAITGQVVEARVLLKEHVSKKGIRKRVRKYCRNKLEPHSAPARIELVDNLPTSSRLKKIRRS